MVCVFPAVSQLELSVNNNSVHICDFHSIYMDADVLCERKRETERERERPRDRERERERERERRRERESDLSESVLAVCSTHFLVDVRMSFSFSYPVIFTARYVGE